MNLKPRFSDAGKEEAEMVRKAKISDAKQIHALLQGFEKVLLPRPLSALYDHVRDYAVYTQTPDGPVLGCCALQIYWEDLAEIRSLAVVQESWGQDIGSRLVDYALAEARGFGIPKVFALTYVPGFFKKHGFVMVEKSELPQKIWTDCLQCIKYPDCDETAMIRVL